MVNIRTTRAKSLAGVLSRPAEWLERLSNRQFGLVLLLPAAIMAVTLYLYPFIFTVVGSLQDKAPFGGTSPFVGLANYRMILNDPQFWNAFKNGLIYAVCTVSLQAVTGVGVALLLNRKFFGNFIARSIIILPYIMAPVGAALVWKWLLNDVLGIVNYSLIKLGVISTPIAFLGDPKWALATVIAISVWKLYPFVTITVLARLETIPGELYDAAMVDGAGIFSRFLYITLPHLKGVLFIVLLLRSIWMFNDFETIWLLTKGGPINFTTVLSIYAYSATFKGAYQISQGMATTMIMFLFLIGLAMIYFRVYRVEEEIA